MSVEPFKLECRLIAVEIDDDGNPVNELPVAEITAYAAKFPDLPGALVDVFEQWKTQRENGAAAGAMSEKQKVRNAT